MAKKDISKPLTAEQKYEKFLSNDPFTSIMPALLNGADVINYVNATGMLDPFYSDQMNGVTYEVKLLGKVKYWYYDKNGEVRQKEIYVGDPQERYPDRGKLEIKSELILEENSITYVTLEPMFRLPRYIVARFNLKVGYVYKGLLLGTGPIIDPGFVGKLSIPLHNLTNNKVKLIAGEPLVAMEFTKISPNKAWDSTIAKGEIAPQKKFSADVSIEARDVFYYTDKAIRGNEKPYIVNDAPSQFGELKKEAEAVRKKFNGLTIGVAISIGGFLFGLLIPTWVAYYDVNRERSDYNKSIIQQEQVINDLKDDVSELQEDLLAAEKNDSANVEQVKLIEKQVEILNRIVLYQDELRLEKLKLPINQQNIDELEGQIIELMAQLKSLQGG